MDIFSKTLDIYIILFLPQVYSINILKCLNCMKLCSRDSKLFAELLNRLREGKHTPDDILKLKERVIKGDISNLIDAPHLFIQKLCKSRRI